MPHFVDGLRRLRGDAKTRALLQPGNVRFRKHHIEFVKILGQAAHFHMVALADDDRVAAFADQPGHGAMRQMHERACGFEHAQTAAAHGARCGVPTRRAP